MDHLRGKRLVISGASSGIGLETARMAVEAGAEVCLVARREDALVEAVRTIGEKAWFARCDVADEDSVRRLATDVGDRWGGLDGLVNNAGVAPMARLDDTTVEVWDEAFAIDVRGPFLMCRELGVLLKKDGSGAVVNMSSSLAVKAIPGMAAYNAAKAALNQMTRSLALEWAPAVRVNAIMPAVVDTPIHALRGIKPEQVQAMGKLHPMGRVGEPSDVASMILFLLSESASWITGAIIPVDGGMTAT